MAGKHPGVADAAPGACYYYQAFDEDGAPAVQGVFTIQRDGAVVTGLWRTSRTGGGDVGPQVGAGRLDGRLDASDFAVTLYSGQPGAAVDLIGSVGAGRIDGQWTWLPPGSAPLTGTFELLEGSTE